MNGDAEDQANKQYTITVPGMSDVFILPVKELNNKELKRQRIIRMKTSRSPVPEPLKWIPGVINQLDDAQDILIVALTLAKPIIKRLPARFIPYVGWALLANDVLNLATMGLSLALTGRPGKIGLRNAIQLLAGNRFKRIKRVGEFMKATNWLGFSLQAGQVLTTLSGYGLRLGGIMGMVSDTTWGAVRALQGNQVRIVGPPPADPISKAARFLSQSFTHSLMYRELSTEDHELMIAAQHAASTIIQSAGNEAILNERAPILRNTKVAVYEPWEPSSIAALQEEGVPITGTLKPFSRFGGDQPDYLKLTQYAAGGQRDHENYMRTLQGYTDRGTVMKMINDEGGSTIWDGIHSEEGMIQEEWDVRHNTVQAMTEWGVFPPYKPDEYDMQDFIEYQAWALEDAALKFPKQDELTAAMKGYFGGVSSVSPWAE